MTKKIRNTALKFAAVVQILALSLLVSCSTVGVNALENVCHATGDAANPYEVVPIDTPDLLNMHLAHPEDIFPMPDGGCPASLIDVVEGKITICHATGSETNPYEEITVSVNGLNGHGDHEEDIIPMPAEGCLIVPTAVAIDTDEIAVCHVTGEAANLYDVVMVPSAELDAYVLANPNDINPMPSTGCPVYLMEVSDGQVTFCHANDDSSKSYEEVTVSADGLDGHSDHEEDVFPTSEADGCPASAVVVNDGKITICHATSSKKKPYVEITVSVNGLNGHDKHDGDLIPAPDGGCPTTKP